MISSRETESGSDRVHDPVVVTETSASSLASAPPRSAMNEDALSRLPPTAESPMLQDGPENTEIVDDSYPAALPADPAVRLRPLAERIVRRHATMAGCGGLIPIPIVNISAITAIIVRMVRTLAGVYGINLQRDRARALVISFLGGTLPTGFAVATSSTLIYLVPGANLAGMAVSSISAVACTRAIGSMFIDYFERENAN
jgi:uncharacterized protein (DUF697 family)